MLQIAWRTGWKRKLRIGAQKHEARGLPTPDSAARHPRAGAAHKERAPRKSGELEWRYARTAPVHRDCETPLQCAGPCRAARAPGVVQYQNQAGWPRNHSMVETAY